MKKQSPIIQAQAYQANRTYPRYRGVSRFEYGDIVLMLLFCFAMYGLFLYYFLPTATPASYRHVVSELGYHWGAAWQSMRYFLAQVSLSLSHTPLVGEWYQILITLMMA